MSFEKFESWPDKWDHDVKPENMRFRCCSNGTSRMTTIDQVICDISFKINLTNCRRSSTFARQLVLGTVEHVEQIDELIRRHAEHWRLDRMAIVDRNLLRLAV